MTRAEKDKHRRRPVGDVMMGENGMSTRWSVKMWKKYKGKMPPLFSHLKRVER